MSLTYNPKMVTKDLDIYVDAANPKCFLGSSIVENISGKGGTFASAGTPDIVSVGGGSYINFDDANDERLYSTNCPSTKNQENYSRFSLFNIDDFVGTAGHPIYIFSNTIGNNADGSLMVFDGKLGFNQYTNRYGNGSRISSNYTINANTWYYGGFTYSKTTKTIKMYVNGEEVFTTTLTDNYGNMNSDDINIGGPRDDSYNGARYFDGKIALVQHYSRVLSDSEIKQNFYALRGRFGI